jgi:hypothetical protein
MRRVLSVALGTVVALVLTVNVKAEDKEVTLKGKITCAKCDFKSVKAADVEKPDACQTVLVVKKKGDKKPTVYFFAADSHKKYHGGICKAGKPGTVTGTVKEEDGKKIITVTELKYKDAE